MNDEQNDPIDDNPIEDIDAEVDPVEESSTEETLEADDEQLMPTPDEMDVDAALAAVSQLTLLADDEPGDIVDAEYEQLSDDDTESPDSLDVREINDDFELPQNMTMSRGQMASVLPALTLIILGAWLTFTLTTTNTAPSAGLLFAVTLIAVGVIFLSQWLTSGRWSRGNFFIGASIALIGGVQLYLSQVATDAINSGWTLWIVAIGLALFGAGYLTLPRLPRLSIMGILTIVAGGIGYVLTSGMISAEVIGFMSNLWIVGVVVLGIMLIAPLLRRRGE